MLQLGPGLLSAQIRGIDSLFPPQPAGYLTDAASVVDAGSAAQIEDLASRLRSATGAELAVVTLTTIGEYAPSDVALAIGRAWRVGARAAIGDPRRNAGLVLLLVPRREGQRGEIYLATGQGIEGIVTDAMAGRIQDLMLPELRSGQYGPALVTGVRALAAVVARGYGVTDSALTAASPFEATRTGGIALGAFVPVLIIAIMVFLVAVRVASRTRGRRVIYWGGPWGGGWGGDWGGFGGGGGGFGGFGGGGGFSGGGSGRSF